MLVTDLHLSLQLTTMENKKGTSEQILLEPYHYVLQLPGNVFMIPLFKNGIKRFEKEG